ncbi:hypothetical protein CONLIGDRAFT_669360 [Coniochaeta ligniaria NRRL 30616]|uniref:Ecp2 effector protein-like domain-containing protein n=1 Tax=Coniochaeta ligniaria NRRL 30616 TaxID=1408157 RepID=A0A1J7IPV1_9PEZI|nr:hypothetical protein CONLIGDRAFT_669360 [Coniochaeta ligniaria NRRL 30616]
MLLPKTVTALGAFITTTSATAPRPRAYTSLVNSTNPIVFLPSDSINECSESTFTDQTSDASPKVDDCLRIATNIAGGGRWEVEAATGEQHQLVQWGTCAFGVKAVPPWGDAFFYVGNQDIIDIINTSIQMFGGRGVVGSKGDMSCQAAREPPNVEWGIYHTK